MAVVCVVAGALVFPRPSGFTGLPTVTLPIEFGPMTNATEGGRSWYNMTVARASQGLEFRDIGFKAQTPSYGNASTENWSLSVKGLTGTTLGQYSWETMGWETGGSTPWSTGQIVSLVANESLSGYILDIGAPNCTYCGYGGYGIP